MGPTLATGRQGWDKLIGRAVAGFPSHRPGKQEEKAAKPPAENEEKENWLGTLMVFHYTGNSAKNSSRTLHHHWQRRQTLYSLSEVNLGYNVWVLSATGAKKEALCASVCTLG